MRARSCLGLPRCSTFACESEALRFGSACTGVRVEARHRVCHSAMEASSAPLELAAQQHRHVSRVALCRGAHPRTVRCHQLVLPPRPRRYQPDGGRQ
eukprot:1012686-Pyramimonas_sp.AAC.2